MGARLTAAQRDAVVERSDFTWMQAHRDKFVNPVPAVQGQRTHIIRDGQAGASGKVLTAEEAQALDGLCREELIALDSDLPYDPMFSPR